MAGAVVITGASRGIGAAAAQAFAGAGWSVVLAARSRGATEKLAGEIGNVVAVSCDVARFADVAAAVETCLARFGRIDAMVNNAGTIDPIAPLAAADPEEWGRAVDVNLKGTFHGIRAALPAMLRQGGGVIVNVSSGAATRPLEGWSAYCAAKAGALMLTRAAHHEAGSRVHVVGLSPGTVATDMQQRIRASGINPVSRLDPAAHIPAEWAGRAILWLATGGNAAGFAGEDVSLRDEAIRRRIGLG